MIFVLYDPYHYVSITCLNRTLYHHLVVFDYCFRLRKSAFICYRIWLCEYSRHLSDLNALSASLMVDSCT